MRYIAAAALTVFAVSGAAGAFAQDATQSQVFAQIRKLRSHGCTGHVGTSAPLRWAPELARAAQLVARGEAPIPAAEKEGFRVTRVFNATLTGPQQAAEVTNVLARQYCEALTNPQFTDFGVERQGSKWIVLLAVRLELPDLDDPAAVVAKVLELTNEARSHARYCGDRLFQPAPPLRYNVRLERAAALHAQDMAAQQYLDHVARDGSTPAQRISRAGYRWQSIGENVAAGQRSAQEVVEGWLASPGHCANIMGDDFTEMGAAFSINMKSSPVVYWAQEFGVQK
jgi:uncharacterized protein YkwD